VEFTARVYKPETNCFRTEIAAARPAPRIGASKSARERAVKSLFKIAIEAIAGARQRRARERLFAQLDERTLRDIGLEREANHARERRRFAMRFGMY
jgi:hypothetical protein